MPVNVATPLPDLDLAPLSTITVTLDDASAVITSLAVHGWQELPPGAAGQSLPPLFIQDLEAAPELPVEA